MTNIPSKEELLRHIIRQVAQEGKVLVGFSGGVDSSLLLWQCVQVLGSDRVIAVTAVSETSFPEEVESAEAFAGNLAVRHLVTRTWECSDPGFMKNPANRCYLCKRIRYGILKELALQSGAAAVLDGTQADDDPADRPGMRALEEFGIATPLASAGIGKSEVRILLEKAGYPDLSRKQAQPCLATRIPVGTPITVEALEKVCNGERILRAVGLNTVRLRDHFPSAAIVTDKAGMALLLAGDGIREQIVSRIKALGYSTVFLNLETYGSTARPREPQRPSNSGFSVSKF